jgi:hypothetical protein
LIFKALAIAGAFCFPRLLFLNLFVADSQDRSARSRPDYTSEGELMPRKKKTENGSTIAVAETTSAEAAPMQRPAFIDGAPVDEEGRGIKDQPPAPSMFEGEQKPEAKNWGPPYKAIYTSTQKGFEMGEDRRFRQRVFKFIDKPEPELLQELKDAGFTYRGNEKAWTITATPETRAISDELAHRFGDRDQVIGR